MRDVENIACELIFYACRATATSNRSGWVLSTGEDRSKKQEETYATEFRKQVDSLAEAQGKTEVEKAIEYLKTMDHLNQRGITEWPKDLPSHVTLAAVVAMAEKSLQPPEYHH